MKIIKRAILVLLALAIVAGLGTYFTAENLDRPVDFKAKLLHEKPNQYLVCPPDYCADKPHSIAHTYKVSASTLRVLFDKAIKSEPRVALITKDTDQRITTYQQNSALMNFPDRITIKFIATSDTTSTLAIYSRSKYGYSDIGANEKRVRRWLNLLDEQIAKQ